MSSFAILPPRNLGFESQLKKFKRFKLFTAPFNNMRTLKLKAQVTNAFFATVNHVRRFLAASDYCRGCGNQIAVHYSDKEAVFGSSRKLGGAAEYLIVGSEERICRSTFEF